MAEKYKGRYEEYINAMPDDDAKKYIVSRVVKQMDYYSKNSAKNQKMFKRLSVLSIVFNGVIPVLVLCSDVEWLSFWVKILIASLSSAAGILSAVISLMNYRELWVQYRVSLELLKGVLDRYFLGVGEFANCKNDNQKSLEILEDLCSQIMSREHDVWKKIKSENNDS